MKLELEVLASTSIKRKKPWPRMAFLGQVQESLFLVDKQRLSTLYIPSGKTKRKIPKLSPILPDVIAMTHSDNGVFLGGLLKSGDVFLWHKDKDMLKFIPGIPALAGKLLTPVEDETGKTAYSPSLFSLAGDGSKFLIVLKTCEVYVWEKEPSQNLFWLRPNTVLGTWSRVMPEAYVLLPTPDCRECCSSARFSINDRTTGFDGICSFVFNDGNCICITTVVLRWFETQDIYSYRHPVYTAEWSSVRHSLTDISPQAMPIRATGALLSTYSHDSSLLAVAINQFDSYQNRMLFVSPWTDTTVAVHMKGSGSKTPITRHARWYWVADMHWTPDDLFIVCVTKQGALCILSRVGEPVILQTHGNSIEMGPKMFLPLHPLIVVQGTADEFADSHSSKDSGYGEDGADPMRQRFSVCTHPTQPIIICSDGYMVTILAMPRHTTCLSMMKGLVTEANRHLRLFRDQQKLQLTMFQTAKRKKRLQSKEGNVRFGRPDKRMGLLQGDNSSVELGTNRYKVYRFEEEPGETLDKTEDSDVDDVDPKGEGLMANIDFSMGKIMFGDEDNMNSTLDFKHMYSDEILTPAERINQCQKDLVLAWGLAASHSGLWTVDHEDVANHIAHDLAKLVTVLLHASPSVLKDLGSILGIPAVKEKKTKKMRNILRVCLLFQSALRLLNMDSVHRHLLISALSMVNSTVKTVLSSAGSSQKETQIYCLHGCYMILNVSEAVLSRTYSSVPRGSHVNGVPYTPQSLLGDMMDPAILSHIKTSNYLQRANLGKVDIDSDVERQYSAGLIQENDDNVTIASTLPDLWCYAEPCKRLTPSWKSLLKQSLYYYKHLESSLSQFTKRTKGMRLREAELYQMVQLIIVLQWKLENMETELSHKTRTRLIPGDRLSIEGSNTSAIHSWIHHLENMSDRSIVSGQTGRVLHAVLYSYLLHNNLRSAITLGELLIRQRDVKKAMSVCKQKEESRQAILSLLVKLPNKKKILPPPMLENRVARHAVQSLARVMAAYFTNQPLFVYPSHCPRRMPPLHTKYDIDHRIHPLYQESLASTLRLSGLGEAWTSERTLEYLLIGGLLPEAVWFVKNLGDWKAAFFIGVALSEHEKLTPELYECKKKLYLPPELQPQAVLQEQLEIIFKPKEGEDGKDSLLVDENTDLEQLTKTLSDLLLAATICHVDIVAWLLDHLASRLRSLSHRFTALVPEGLYLPAPPVYCPQPARNPQESMAQDVVAEVELRREVSSVIVLLQLVFSGSHTTIPAASWYVQKVMEAFAKGLKFRKGHQKNHEIELDIQVLQDTYLSWSSSFEGLEINPSVHQVLVAFRDMCSVTWMMHIRDKLSLSLRKKAELAEKKIGKSVAVSDIEWLAHCKNTLKWALHMIPFSHCLVGGENALYGTLISLIIELPPTEASGKILAEHFYDVDKLDPEVQDKVQWIMKEWQGIFLDENLLQRKHRSSASSEVGDSVVQSPRGMTLSLYYQKEAQKVERLLRRKMKTFGGYEEFVYGPHTGDGGTLEPDEVGVECIGSRPFESTEEYLQFLDVFYAIAFHQIMDAEQENKGEPSMPLLLEYANEVREHELNSLCHKAVTSVQKKQGGLNVVSVSSPRDVKSIRVQRTTVVVKAITKKTGLPVHPNPRKKGGLFRSRSFSDIKFDGRKKKTPRSPRSPRDHLNSPWLGPGPWSNTSTHNCITQSQNAERLEANSLPAVTKISGKLQKSMSASDIRKQVILEEESMEELTNKPDPLASPVVPEWLLDNMKFEPKWNMTEQLLQWLYRWSNRNHILVSANQYQPSSPRNRGEPLPSRAKSYMKIRVPPRMVMYSLWLLENVYYPHPSYASQAQIPSDPVEITVATGRRLEGVPSPYHRGSIHPPLRDPTPPPPDTGRSDFTTVTEVSEGISRLGLDGPTYQGHVAKESKKKRSKTKRTLNRCNSEDSGAMEEQKVTTTESKTVRKLSFKLPDPDTESRQSSTRSESSLNVSSLVDEDVMNETVASVVRQHLGMSGSSVEGQRSGKSTVENSMKKDSQSPLHRRSKTVTGGSDNRQPGSLSSTHQVQEQQLQTIVREELKRIMMAQQQGIVAMLGALDQPNKEAQQTAMPADHLPDSLPQNQNKKIPANRNTDCVVLTVHNNVTPGLGSSSDVDLTPIPSDDPTEESKSSIGKPMTMADLNKETLASQQRYDYRNSQPLYGALSELGSLENRYGVIASPTLPPPGYFSLRGENKENYQVGPASDPHNRPSHPTSTFQSAYQPAQLTQVEEPFQHLMGILRQMNHDLGIHRGTGVKAPMSFLSLQGGHASIGSERLPPLQAWPEQRPGVPAGRATGQSNRMPFIPLQQQSASNYQQGHQVAEREHDSGLPGLHNNRTLGSSKDPAQEGFMPFPLLKLHDESKPFDNIETHQGIKLVPPEEIIEYEQRKYQGRALSKKQLKDYLRKENEQQKASQGKPQQHPGVRLLKADFEPFSYADERDNEKRQRRRSKKDSERRNQAQLSCVAKENLSLGATLGDMSEESIEGSLPDTVVRLSPRKQSPRKTPRSTKKDDAGQVEPEEEQGTRLHEGYALSPGMFDDYLDKDGVMTTDLDSNARIQYRAATGITPKKSMLMKDAACDTDGDLAVNQTGSDPVNAAFQNYYRVKTGHSAGILPPDIFLGLRFNDTKSEESPGAETGAEGPNDANGRAFLSVVDIGGDMLDELTSKLPQNQMKSQNTPGINKSSRLKGPRQKGRVEFQVPEKEEDALLLPGPDSVTVHLLDDDPATAGFKMPSEEDIARGHRFRSKESIHQRLGDMNHQFNAIAAMAQNIESDLKSSKMLLHTVEQIGEALNPTADTETPPARVLQHHDTQDEEHDIFKNKVNLKPSEIKNYRKQDLQEEQTKPKQHEDLGEELGPDDRIQDIRERLETSQEQVMNQTDSRMDVSGLSGVSDIIGEVLATGGLDSAQLGLTQREHDKLVARAIQSTREGKRLSSEELKKIFQDRKRVERSEKEKKELHEWMEKKRLQKGKQWKEQISTLREAERTPYIPPARDEEDSLIRTGTQKEIQEAEKIREDKRQKREMEAMERRKEAASELMGAIINEQSNLTKPEPSWAWDEAPIRGKGMAMANRATSNINTTGKSKAGTTVPYKSGTAPRARFVSPVRGERFPDHDRTHVTAEDYMYIRVSQDQPVRSRRTVGAVERSGTGGPASMRTSDGLQAYTKHLENLDTGEWQDTTPRRKPEGKKEVQRQPQPRPYKPKPFTSMVRLQRPEAVRGRVHRPHSSHVDRPRQSRPSGTDRSTGDRQQQERLYGTKRLPGTYKANERRAPRQVKTYQQRLAEMKSSRPPMRPLRRTYGASGMSSAPSRMLDAQYSPRRVVKPRKTLTYAQQLQQLQPPKEVYQSGESSVPMHTNTLRRSRGPAHKPKTYVEQLQELQHPATPSGPMRPNVYHSPPAHGHARSRPYADPYWDAPQDNLSVNSPWSMDEDVQRLLYDEGSESFLNPTSGAGTDFDISELTEMDNLGERYTDLVAVEDLTEAASFSSGSIMSYIDWDAVENLIADVK